MSYEAQARYQEHTLVELCPQKIVHEAPVILIPSIHSLVLEDQVCKHSQLGRPPFDDWPPRTVIPPPLDRERARRGRVEALRLLLAERGREVEQRVCGRDLRLARDRVRRALLALLPRLLLRALPLDLLELA